MKEFMAVGLVKVLVSDEIKKEISELIYKVSEFTVNNDASLTINSTTFGPSNIGNIEAVQNAGLESYIYPRSHGAGFGGHFYSWRETKDYKSLVDLSYLLLQSNEVWITPGMAKSLHEFKAKES